MNTFEHPLLATISQKDRMDLQTQSIMFKPNSKIITRGEELFSIFFVLSGTVYCIYYNDKIGVRTIIDTMGAGEAIGYEYISLPAVSNYDFIAYEQTEVIAVSINDYINLLNKSNEFSMALLSYSSNRTKLLTKKIILPSNFDINRVLLDRNLLSRVPSRYMGKRKIIPVGMQGGNLALATVGSPSHEMEQELLRFLQFETVVYLKINRRDFERTYKNMVLKQEQFLSNQQLNTWYQGVKNKNYLVNFEKSYDFAQSSDDKVHNIDGSEVIKILNKIIGEAVDLEASDIHFEPYADGINVRFRIDGELMKRPAQIEHHHLLAAISRIKVMARLDIAEKRKAQDGRLSVILPDKTVDMRVSTIPTLFGEKLVLRLLDPGTILINLESLIITNDVHEAISRMIEQPMGMVLVTGPTGSGKTTTVYSMLLQKKEEPINIMTIEDPIEYSLKGITQIQRNPYVDLDFPGAIRAFLRQDPDVIIVGETRDPETAKAAIEAGLTGHLVISTIHANNVFSTIYRLSEMGIESYILANTIIGIVAQRLVKRTCLHCSESTLYHKSLIDPLNLTDIAPPTGDHYTFRKGSGCAACNFTGYHGRIAVFEVLRITDEFKPFLASNLPVIQLRQKAQEMGLYVPMKKYASVLLEQGLTTPEQISGILLNEN